MISSQAIRKCLLQLGYRGVDLHSDYRFAAVDAPGREIRSVDVAAFLDGPASYKTAALAVVQARDTSDIQGEVGARRSLGAPYLIVLGEDRATAWTYTINGPTKIDESSLNDWENLVRGREELFGAKAIRQLKLVRVRGEATACLFDPATLRDIQADTQNAVFELLERFLERFQDTASGQLSLDNDYRVLFPMIFRLLAAKILTDRDDERLSAIDIRDVKKTLTAIEQLYSLPPLSVRWSIARQNQVSSAWDELRSGLYVRNVAADDLAFVYEHALITPEIRQSFGTHSTPPSVADYVIRSFAFPTDGAAQELVVFEPFAGSCVFLTAALRRFKELLPDHWTPKRLHEHLVAHFKASEIDPFACEIARLALILADYPNHNGWRIENEDLYSGDLLYERAKSASIVVCNPPFEDFLETPEGHSIHKPISALQTILHAKPSYLGIVMPAGLSTHKKYASVLEVLTHSYCDVEVLKLPEGVFHQATVGAEVLIAQQPRNQSVGPSTTRIFHSEVARLDLRKFEHSLRPTRREEYIVDPRTAPGLVGLRPLRDVWEELSKCWRLGSVAEIHRGLEWTYDQAKASRPSKAAGFRPGLHRYADGGLAQFRITDITYLDCRPESLRGGAIRHPWDRAKLICNSIRSSRGPWRLAASVDLSELVASQQFFGIWMRLEDRAVPRNNDLQALCTIINSPIANAFTYCHDNVKGIRVSTMEAIPLPRHAISSTVYELIDKYLHAVGDADSGPLFENNVRDAASILMEIDAAVLAAYDLPPRLERALLRFMNNGERPCRHSFPNYPGAAEHDSAIPLKGRLSIKKGERAQAWAILRTPLPEEVADVFSQA